MSHCILRDGGVHRQLINSYVERDSITVVTEGIIQRNANARLFRDDELLIEGKIESLKRFKDDAKEVKDGLECGIGIVGAKKYKEGDLIEVYEIEEIKRTLD